MSEADLVAGSSKIGAGPCRVQRAILEHALQLNRNQSKTRSKTTVYFVDPAIKQENANPGIDIR